MLHSIDDALSQIRAMDLENISEKVQLTLNSIEQVINNADVKDISEKLKNLLIVPVKFCLIKDGTASWHLWTKPVNLLMTSWIKPATA